MGRETSGSKNGGKNYIKERGKKQHTRSVGRRRKAKKKKRERALRVIIIIALKEEEEEQKKKRNLSLTLLFLLGLRCVPSESAASLA